MNMPFTMETDPEHFDVSKFYETALPAEFYDRLNISEKEPYTSNREILRDYSFLHLLCTLKTDTQSRYLNVVGHNELPLSITHDEKKQSLHYLQETIETFRGKIEKRISATECLEETLTFLLFSRKCRLSIKEREAFAYMINSSIGMDHDAPFRAELRYLNSVTDMGFDDFTHFLAGDRLYMSQELVEINEGLGSSPIDMKFKLSEKLLLFFLAEHEWGEEELLTIEDTVLHEIFQELGRAPLETDNSQEDVQIKEHEAISTSHDETGYDLDDFDLHEYLAKQKAMEEEFETFLASEDDELHLMPWQPYCDDREYLADQFRCLEARYKLRDAEEESDKYGLSSEPSKTEKIRLARLKLKKSQANVRKRLEITKNKGGWFPRMEALADKRKLDGFEKQVVIALAGLTLSETLNKGINGGFSIHSRNATEVGKIIDFFADSFRERLSFRKYFYRGAKLVAEGMVSLTGDFTTDVLDYKISLDRKMLDYIAGLDTELCNIVDGGNIYFPKVKLENVILPERMKREIVDLVKNSYEVERIIKKYDTNRNYAGGCGTVLLFHGPPGTGKTMMANALANHLGKKIMMINFPTLGEMHGDKVLNYVLREAKVNDAVVFIDECEGILESRDNGNKNVNVLLTAIERHEGIIIMATNRPYDIDSAMENRMTYRFEFKVPDMYLRERIWKEHLPEGIALADDINLSELAMRYEFSGRSVKNAVIAAISYSLSKDGKHLLIDQKSLEKGARMQLQGHLRRANLERSVVPRHGLSKLVLPRATHEALNDIIRFEKAKPILHNEWDFQSVASYGYGNGVLFHGPPGTGKTMAAEAIGYEIGSPLMVVTAAELQSKYVGETAKNIDAIFKMAKNNNCILVFDDAEGLFGHRTAGSSSTDKYANMDSSLLLEHMERFPGMVILTTNIEDIMDSAFKDRLKHKIEFKMPNREMREKIWRNLVPEKTPLADDVDFSVLAQKYTFSGRTIKNCIFKAAAKAAVRPENERFISMADFIAVAESENGGKENRKVGF